jgi:hypothetical protein
MTPLPLRWKYGPKQDPLNCTRKNAPRNKLSNPESLSSGKQVGGAFWRQGRAYKTVSQGKT